MSFILVRHSKRDDNIKPDKYKTRNNDCLLSMDGFIFAKEKANELKEVLEKNKIKISKIISSPFLRTMQTAEIYQKILCPDVKIEEEPLLSEGQNHYVPDGINTQLTKKLKNAGISFPETLKEINDRCKKLITSIIEKKEMTLIITHGIIWNNIMETVEPKYKYVPEKDPWKYKPTYCDVAVFKDGNFVHSTVDTLNHLY